MVRRPSVLRRLGLRTRRPAGPQCAKCGLDDEEQEIEEEKNAAGERRTETERRDEGHHDGGMFSSRNIILL